MVPPNKKKQLTIAKAARLATPTLGSFASAAELWRYVPQAEDVLEFNNLEYPALTIFGVS